VRILNGSAVLGGGLWGGLGVEVVVKGVGILWLNLNSTMGSVVRDVDLVGLFVNRNVALSVLDGVLNRNLGAVGGVADLAQPGNVVTNLGPDGISGTTQRVVRRRNINPPHRMKEGEGGERVGHGAAAPINTQSPRADWRKGRRWRWKTYTLL